MRFIPNSSEDIREMLKTIGKDSISELFESIPADLQLDAPLELPPPMSEIELRRWFRRVADRNLSGDKAVSFLGAGVYHHYQPACVDQLLLRGEFLTAYTPYQPEISQGTLQTIFEYQTHQSLLTGLEVANASLYDGSTAFVEAVLMASRVRRNTSKVIVSRGVHPEYVETLRTYVQNLEIEIVMADLDDEGRTSLESIAAHLDEAVFAVAVQSPNFFGMVEDYDAVRQATEQQEGLIRIAVIAEASSLGILSPPGAHGFQIACGEGQAWGIAPQFGGPFVGFLVAADELKRHMPGRLVGETVDVDGRRAWVLTLASREQHIRRGKATSNICTNQALIALAANIYLSLMGKDGLREVAMQCLGKAAYLRRRLERIEGVEMPYPAPIYNEIFVRTAKNADSLMEGMEKRDILGGVPLGRYFDEEKNGFLVAVTELHTRADLDRYADELEALVGGAE